MWDNGTTRSVLAANMPSLIPKPAVTPSDSTHLLPRFLQLGSKITYEQDGQYHKGFLNQSPDGVYRFSYKSHINKKTKDWGSPLPNLATMWQDLCIEGVLLPGHQALSFQRPLPPHNNHASASLVSAVNLECEYPSMLLTGLHVTHPDCNTWLASFHKEKSGTQFLNTYVKIGLVEYRVLCAKKCPTRHPHHVLSLHQERQNVEPT